MNGNGLPSQDEAIFKAGDDALDYHVSDEKRKEDAVASADKNDEVEMGLFELEEANIKIRNFENDQAEAVALKQEE